MEVSELIIEIQKYMARNGFNEADTTVEELLSVMISQEKKVSNPNIVGELNNLVIDLIQDPRTEKFPNGMNSKFDGTTLSLYKSINNIFTVNFSTKIFITKFGLADLLIELGFTNSH